MQRKSLLQGDYRECYITGSHKDLDLHHVFHGPRRKAADEWGCWVWLRHDIHMALHDKDKTLDRQIQQDCQRAFEAMYGRQKFMEVFGKSYLTDDEEEDADGRVRVDQDAGGVA